MPFPFARGDRRPVLLGILTLLALNLIIVGKLFAVEYSAYNGSVEGTFIAISRLMAKHPGDFGWWPYWGCGMPFEVTYLPFEQWTVAAVILLTHLSAARAFHIVSAFVYACSAPAVFHMALVLSRKFAASFLAALAYSCFSFANLLIPAIRTDSLGLWNLRRLQIMVYWGEYPHTFALALLPVAVLCFSRAFTTGTARWKIFAGVSAAAVILSNAFGLVSLGVAVLCLLAAFEQRPWWKAPIVAAIGVLTWCWISPWLSPTMIRAIRASAPTVGGDFRYHTASWITLAATVVCFALLALLLRRLRIAPYLRFFLLFAYVQCAIVLTWYAAKIAVIAQPHRLQLEMDLALPLAVVFGAAEIFQRIPRRARYALASLVLLALIVQSVHAVAYAWDLIRAADPARMPELHLAQWLDRNRPGERAFLTGANSLVYNIVSDNPQMKGGHDQHAVNPLISIAAFAIFSDMNAGDRAASASIFWLKAFGARAISVPGPQSNDFYKPFVHPRKFEGLLPVIWREDDLTLYEVPSRSASLAHIIPASAVVARTPIHGLDLAPAQAYVAALDDPRYPLADFHSIDSNEAEIRADLEPGQVVALQITYDPGWEAWAAGRRQTIRRDGLGLMVIAPDCRQCRISLRYTGGTERIVTRTLSIGAMLVVALWFLRRRQVS